ncbi:MAG: erythromycin esterase family protein [Bacteroidota bacterium]
MYLKHLLLIFIFTSGLALPLQAQWLTTDQLAFIREASVSLEVDETYQNGTYDPILQRVADKRLVLLGEFNHGSKEIFASRNELIRHLHEQLGFDLILFESGLGEIGAVHLNIHRLKDQALTAGFFWGWRNQEFVALMEYAKAQQIKLAGFDIQRTGWTFTQYVGEKLDDPQSIDQLEKQFIEIKTQLSNYRTVYDSVKTATHQLITAYASLQSQLDTADHFARKVIDNRMRFLTYLLDFSKTKDWNQRWKDRDLAMADNIKWILQQYAPTQKAIIVAHNFHISRYNEKEEVMGEFLQAEFGEEMYVMGVFAKEGAFTNNGGETEILSPADTTSLDIKHIIEADQARMSFLDIPQSPGKGSEWLHQPIIINNTFIDLSRSNSLILSRAFDGLLLLDSITPSSN